ncbi:transporter [Bacillus coahuilensis p1.1.43]|uniref:Transporter n=1 Tax=Bacillus coahuilensis p1.1.43 TaxID=1150625 RepID=A0A147K636_9BACI|nr:sodium-dependent transporter [Bacillus coahuilensis]KUP05301.1 transporter [Bacillus coahuilensis p1.1.43]
MENRPQWGTRAGFILAAVGSAVGLGNIWRFPGVAYENGGGAFFIPYLFALLTAGIPLLILEFTIGHKYRGSAPLSYARASKGSEWIGWWQVAISFVISTYYAVIIAWAMAYAYFSISLKWNEGDDTVSFLVGNYLQTGEAGAVGSIVPGVFIPLLIVWAVTLGVLFAGVKKGIELANKIMIPLLVVLFLIIVVRAVTLDGAMDGLNAFFSPNWDLIADPSVWVAAYGQIFFSLSIAFAIMITYASYLPKKSDITNNAFITGFANSSVELLAGFGVFAALGFLAAQNGIAFSELGETYSFTGVILAFAVFPEIINQFPILNEVFGVLFFACLVLAGLSSLISIVETFVAGIQDKFNVSRSKAVLFGGGLSAVISVLFATQGGLNFLDVADEWINQFGIALVGLVEVIFFAWIAKQLTPLQQYANEVSDIKLGLWWKVSLGLLTPVVLGYMMYGKIKQRIVEGYGGYEVDFLFNFGWSVALGAILFGVLFANLKWRNQVDAMVVKKKEVS